VSVLQGAEQYIQQLTQSLSRVLLLLPTLSLRLPCLLLLTSFLRPPLLLLLLHALSHGRHHPQHQLQYRILSCTAVQLQRLLRLQATAAQLQPLGNCCCGRHHMARDCINRVSVPPEFKLFGRQLRQLR
jgi:hypothetical protein